MINLSSKKEFKIALIVTFMFLIIYAIVGTQLWTDTNVEDPSGFCEEKIEGIIKEPMNSLSSLTFVGVGLYILYFIDKLCQETD